MNWLALLKALLLAAAAFARWLHEKQRMDSARADVVAEHLRHALAEIAKADGTRSAIRNRLRDHPSGLRDDDGFRRSD